MYGGNGVVSVTYIIHMKTWVTQKKIKFKLRIKLNHNIYNMWASEPVRQVRQMSEICEANMQGIIYETHDQGMQEHEQNV